MSVFQALSLMIAFGLLVATILNGKSNKKAALCNFGRSQDSIRVV